MTTPPKHVGPYEILGLLGEGGMGTVYRARDPRLDRSVALKVLRTDAAGNPDRQARFVQEAKSVSSLNHPNIVVVHDVGVHDGMAYMVMEMVDGQPLDQLIPPRGMRASEVLRIGSQIADAFSLAHAARIVHRDLKPANVMVQANGRVKVLDFGLAKMVHGDTLGQTVTQTSAGIIVGTTAYMSPEQAEGRPLDARSDIFSFGAVLYEMCTGQRAFQGDSHASVLANVLRDDPRPLAEVRAELPSELTRLITRCLRKDPERRVQSMADLKVAFDELRDELDSGRLAPAVAPGAVSAARPWVAALAAAVVAAVLVTGYFVFVRGVTGPEPAAAVLQPLPLTTYPGSELTPNFSPDGKSIAFAWTGEQQGGNFDIYVQLIGAGVPLRLTQEPQIEMYPQWSPDGRYIAFIRRMARERVALVVVPALGGQERRLAEFSVRLLFDQPLASIAWTPDGKHLLATGGRSEGEASAVHLVSADSGEVRTIIKADGMDGYWPIALSPDGRTLAAVRNGSGAERATQLFRLTPEWSVDGEPIEAPIVGDVLTIAWTTDSRELIYRLGANTQLPLYRVAVPDGVPTPMPWVGADARGATISGPAKRLAYSRVARDTNIWRLALDGADTGAPPLNQILGSSFRDVFPQYSPDGKRLVFYSNRSASIQIWTANADGNAAVQLTNMDPVATTGSPRWSPDGRRIVFDSNAGGRYQLYEVSADGGPARPITADASDNFTGAWSPDGKWMYFSSDRGGRLEVWRQPDGGGAAEQVTKNGGSSPTVSPDGAWLYFIKDDNAQALWRMPLDGGEESKILEGLFRFNYVVTPTAVYYVARGIGSAPAVLRKLELATRQTKDLLVFDKPADLGLTMSPDSRYLLFCKIDYSGADLMVVENFR